jgi:tetratricopeptide (TPR) repeat protein
MLTDINPPVTWNAVGLGPFYEISENLTLARAHYEADLKAEEADHGQDHPHALIALNHLARTLFAQGNIKDAQLRLEQLMDVALNAFGPVHPEVALQACHLGDLFYRLGGYNEARSYYQRALLIIESLFGRDHLRAASILACLARTAEAQSDKMGSKAYLDRALGII